MEELFPIATGFVLGIIFASSSRWFRSCWVRAALILLAGVSATFLSGEWRDNRAFVIVDIGEVALLAWIAFFLVRRFAIAYVPATLRKRIGAR